MKFALSKTTLQNWEERLPAGLYKGIHLRFSGTNTTGNALSVGDIGNLTVTLNGEMIMFIPTGFLSELNNQLYGYAESSSTTGGSFAFGLFIPFSYPGFPSGLHVKPDDDLFLGLQVGSNVSTYVSSWTIEVNMVETNEPEKYIMKILPANESHGGSGTFKKRIPNKNVFEVYVNGANISRVTVERDGELLHEADYNSLISETSLKRRVEGSLVSYVALTLGDQVSDLLSDTVDIQYTLSAGDTVYIQYIAFDFNPERKTRSVQIVKNRVQSRVAPIANKRPQEVNVTRELVKDASPQTETAALIL